MTELFLNIVNMSISASWVVLAVLLLRFLLKKAPKWITVLLWGIVAVRLICPFTLESAVSLIPSAETINPEITSGASPQINSGISMINSRVNTAIDESFVSDSASGATALQTLVPILSAVWVLGIAAMLLYAAVSFFKVKRRVGTAVLFSGNIYRSENVASPFVLGVVKPKIYLPFNISDDDLPLVIAHEKAHIRRKDNLWKPLGFLLLALYWFNPLMWLAYVLLCRDIEFACDEKVVKELSAEQKADYSQALLTCSVNRRMITACPVAFGEVGVKDRVKSVLNYKKPAFWIIIAAVVASVVAAVCFLTNPAANTLGNIEFLNLESIKQDAVEVLVPTDGNNLCVDGVNKELLGELCDIKISKKAMIFSSRSNDRDTSHTLIIQRDGYEEWPYDLGLRINFNSSFTSVWVDNGVKPTLSYRVINPKKAKQIYENISKFVCYEKLVWVYVPGAGATYFYQQALAVDLDYTHINAACTEGAFFLQNLKELKFSHGTQMRFEKGETVYWVPAETEIDKIPQKSEVTLEIYNGKKLLHKCTVVFECVSRGAYDAVFEIYLKEADGLYMAYYSYGVALVEQSAVSAVCKGYSLADVTIYSEANRLKEKFPNYFGLDVSNGLSVYIWQEAEGAYSCGLLPGKNTDYTKEELWKLQKSPATLDEMRTIVSDYAEQGMVSKDDITVNALVMPHSSYYYTVDDEYIRSLNDLFWLNVLPTEDETQE